MIARRCITCKNFTKAQKPIAISAKKCYNYLNLYLSPHYLTEYRLKKVLRYLPRFKYFALVFFVLAFTSCSELSDRLSLIKEEYSEIKEFFTPPMSDKDSVYASAEEEEWGAEPLLRSVTHIELIASPYNPSISVTAVSSVGSSEPLSLRGTSEVSESEKLGYTHIPQLSDNSAEKIKAALDSANIEYKTVPRSNTAPEGETFAIEYAGFSCDDGYYINPAVPVTLYVSAEKPAKTAESGDNLIYLTFDDGPDSENTPILLDILDKYGVKAAFFHTGEAIEKSPDISKNAAERGHTVGCHSVSHNYNKIYASLSSLEEEIIEWERITDENGITKEFLGQLTFRFPGGSVGKYFTESEGEQMKKMLESRGYYIYDWNVVTNDSVLYLAPEDTASHDYIKANFIETLNTALRENGSTPDAPIIILMHETVDETADLLKWMLEYLISESFTFGNIKNLGSSWTFADR